MTLDRKLIVLQSLMLAARRLYHEVPDDARDLKVSELLDYYQKVKQLACEYGRSQEVTQEECDYILKTSVVQAISPYSPESENYLGLLSP